MITARITATKNATYVKSVGGKVQSLARQIVRYYDVSGYAMGAINKQVIDIKAYLDKTITVASIYPDIANDPTTSDWKEDPWVVTW